MATVTRENIGLLHDKLTVTVVQEDYLSQFEKSLKQYAKNANIPGFRKGMVPASLIRKMYGQSVYTEEVLKTVEKALNNYLVTEKIVVFGQPLPLDTNSTDLNPSAPKNYDFSFEIGLQPAFTVDTKNAKLTQYKVAVTDAMIDEEVARLQKRHGKMLEPETVTNEECFLNVTFSEADAEGNIVPNGIEKADSILVKYFTEAFRKNVLGKQKEDVLDVNIATDFEEKEKEVLSKSLGLTAETLNKKFKMTITKIGLVEKAVLDEAFFLTAYPNKTIANETEFRAEVKKEIESQYTEQGRIQLQNQIYQHLLDSTHFEFPELFLKRWMQMSGEKQKTEAAVEEEFPMFKKQLKWMLISEKLTKDYAVEVAPQDIKNFAKKQLFSYMGGSLGNTDQDQQWVEDYANRMMQDKKYVEDSYQRITIEKMFEAVEKEIAIQEEELSLEAFTEKLHQAH